jgi:TadE-like protein
MNVKSTIAQKLRCFIGQEKGAALAELAILVPFLILMVAGVAEFGRFFETYTRLSKSTRAAARYLSNHPFDTNQDKARNLAVCGKLSCAGTPPLVANLTTANICIESTGSPKVETLKVSIPRAGGGGCGAPLQYQPIFDIGALLHTGFTFTPAISPSTTMYYMLD